MISAAGLLLLAGASAVYALRCLADGLLASAFVYALAGLGLMGGAAKVAAGAL